MAFNFNSTYTLRTEKGNYLIPIFKYDGDLHDAPTFVSNSTYHGESVQSDSFNIQTSLLRVSKYRLDNTPAMGLIRVLKKDGSPSDYTIYSEDNGSNLHVGVTYTKLGWTYVVSYSGVTSSSRTVFSTVGVLVDSLDNYYFNGINLDSYGDSPEPAFTPNTENNFGFYEGGTYNKVQFTISNKNIILSDFTKNFAPLLSEFDTDPYEPGGGTQPGGGEGDFDGESDPIDFPPLPTLSAVDTGFITLFNPSLAELHNLASYLWGDLFDITTWKKIFADPMDAILGMSIVPVAVPNGGAGEITVGNIPTGVSMNRAASQYVEVDCGTLNVNEYWGAYLDYDPYTKAELYLPFVGTHPIAVDDIMNKAVHIKYHVDILSGACCAYVKCGSSVLYSFVGQCSSSIPITGNDWTNVINGALSIAASIGTMVATGGAAAPMAIAGIASTATNSLKPSVEKSGALGGMGGMLAIQTPYLILTRPRQALPSRQNAYMGYPSFITYEMSELSGYTEIESVHLENIPATEGELTEIETLLKGGVIF